MTTLAIETATANRQRPASVWLDGELMMLEEPNSQAAKLVSSIEQALEAKGIWYDALEQLLITVGPGSFTGIRIGLAVARTISFACPSVALLPISTLEVLMSSCEHDEPTLALLPAGKGELYAQTYEREDGLWQASSAIKLCEPQALDDTLLTYGPSLFITADMLATSPERIRIAEREPVPLYIRPPDAKLPQGGVL